MYLTLCLNEEDIFELEFTSTDDETAVEDVHTGEKAVKEDERCTDSSCSDHKFVDVPENEFPVHAHVPQYHTILPISSSGRFPHLLSLLAHDQLSNPGQNKVLLFLPTTCVTQHFATFTRELSNVILPGAYIDIHSKHAQDSRIAASDAFDAEKSGASIFVSSDDSVRGVDYLGVTRVIQFVGWDEIRMFTETTLIESTCLNLFESLGHLRSI
ncbi:hypothetical protein EDD22DRAFT_854531 [Suillus occidentalis]|nr:hypothetical protein EDD22DRAFT_854531 [Suillus occidentalis]